MNKRCTARGRAWEHEFELQDEEISERLHRRERAYRTALLRHRSCTSVADKPTDLPQQLAEFSSMPLTRHASVRLKSRGINLDQVVAVSTFAKPQPSHGATRYALDKKSRQMLEASLPPAELKRLGSLDILVVLSDDGCVITAAHRTQRLRRH